MKRILILGFTLLITAVTAGAGIQDFRTILKLSNFAGAGVVPITDFGAVPNDTGDDTAAIIAAVAYATENGKSLSIPNGTFIVSGSGSAIFTITKPIEITGKGYFSVIQVAASVPNTRDVFLYTSTADAVGYTFPLFRDFRIEGAVDGAGRHGINITTPTNSYAFRFGVERMEFRNLAGHGVWADQSASSTTVHTSWIRDSRFVGNGFGGTSLYDSWALENNQLTGTGYASVAGAGKLTLRDSNVTASSGVKIGGSAGGHVNLVLDNNYFETLFAYDGDGGAYVNLAGTSRTPLLGPMVTCNIFSILTGKNDPHALQLDYTKDAVVSSNWFSVAPSASYANFVTANSVNAYIAPDNVYSSQGAGRLSNAGVMTSGGRKTLAILNADSTAVVNTNAVTPFDKTYVIKANYLKAGQTLRIRAAGKYSNTGSPTLEARCRVSAYSNSPIGVPQ
jgi:hypothetical protein